MGMLVAQEFERVRREIDDAPARRPAAARAPPRRSPRPAGRRNAAPDGSPPRRTRHRASGSWYMSPSRTMLLASPARSRLTRATASISRDWSMPRACVDPRRRGSRACGRCRCRYRAGRCGSAAATISVKRRLDLALVDVERADAVPLRGILAEIGGGALGALALDRREPLQVERDRRIALAAGGHEMPGERACRLGGAAAGRTPSCLRGSGRAGRPRTAASDGARRAAGSARGSAPTR